MLYVIEQLRCTQLKNQHRHDKVYLLMPNQQPQPAWHWNVGVIHTNTSSRPNNEVSNRSGCCLHTIRYTCTAWPLLNFLLLLCCHTCSTIYHLWHLQALLPTRTILSLALTSWFTSPASCESLSHPSSSSSSSPLSPSHFCSKQKLICSTNPFAHVAVFFQISYVHSFLFLFIIVVTF